MSRTVETLRSFAAIGQNEDGSVTRLGSSAEYFQAAEAVVKAMRDLGMNACVDPVGNACGVLPGDNPDAKAIVIGSHLDTVVEGGLYDGALGVAGALEVVARLRDGSIRLHHPLVVWGFNLEESSPVGGTFGSRAVTGAVDADAPGLQERLPEVHLDRQKVLAARRDTSRYGCYLELHIEQGDRLDRQGIQIGVVSGIVSVIRYEVTAQGTANHAGTTMMAGRRDAMVAMSKLIAITDAQARSLDEALVFTVGKLSVHPGQENVIPGKVTATFEMRHMDKAVTDRFIQGIRQSARDIPDADFSFVNTVAKYATPCDNALVETIDQVCGQLGVSRVIMPSGAGHDANPMAHAGVPIGMIFVPSKNGMSHCGAEYTPDEDIERGVDVLYHTVLTLDKQR